MISADIIKLVNYGAEKGLIKETDRVFAINRILSVLGLSEFTYSDEENDELHNILERILDWAVLNGRLDIDTTESRDLLDTELMAAMMPRPSEVIDRFNDLYEKNKVRATDYFYELSRSSNYIRVDRVKKDLCWSTKTDYGDIIITINLSKPEKDPKAIAAAKEIKSSGYPLCALCSENEGYKGSLIQPPRGNHRIIPIILDGERWFFQYSPYVYYNEHCIVLNEKHIPMRVCESTFRKLLEFVGKFPHYFIGSNADLPIVGGSILSHDHFQGGRFEFPMAKAGISKKVSFEGFSDVDAGIVKWPMSVIRIKSKNSDRLTELASRILDKWQNYSDPSADILAFSDGTPHNTITPIARMRDGLFELDLVLRNNRTTKEFEDGIFHPHKEYHNIKKENIGLIEVMGLAILPARLKDELSMLLYYLNNPKEKMDEAMQKHLNWYNSLKGKVFDEEMLKEEVGIVFSKILENAGVYKNEAAFMKFINNF